MFESLFPEHRLFKDFYNLHDLKAVRLAEPEEIARLVEKQIDTLEILDSPEEDTNVILLKEVASYFRYDVELNILGKLQSINSSQTKVLADSLNEDFSFISACWSEIRDALTFQKELLDNNYSIPEWPMMLKKSFGEEAAIAAALEQKLHEQSGLKKKLKDKILEVKKLKHSPVFRKLTKGISKGLLSSRFRVVTRGLENIPLGVAAILAPSRLQTKYDPMLLKGTIRREIFFLTSSDWARHGIDAKLSKWVFDKEGDPSLNRPGLSIKSSSGKPNDSYRNILRLLALNQVLVAYPDAYAANSSAMSSSEIKVAQSGASPGIFQFVDAIQKKKNQQIPVIPVGLQYDNLKKIGSTVFINIGLPIFLPISEEKADYSAFRDLLLSEIKKLSVNSIRINPKNIPENPAQESSWTQKRDEMLQNLEDEKKVEDKKIENITQSLVHKYVAAKAAEQVVKPVQANSGIFAQKQEQGFASVKSAGKNPELISADAFFGDKTPEKNFETGSKDALPDEPLVDFKDDIKFEDQLADALSATSFEEPEAQNAKGKSSEDANSAREAEDAPELEEGIKKLLESMGQK